MKSLGWFTVIQLRIRERRESELRASEAFSEQVFEAAGDCVALLSAAGLILRVNELTRRHLSLLSPVGKPKTLWADVWSGAQRELALEAFEQARTGGTGTFRGEHCAADGEVTWWEVWLWSMARRR